MKKKQRPEPMVGPSTTIFKFFVSILLNEKTKSENEREYMYKQERKRRKIIVVMASRRRAMKELGGSHFPLTPRPVVAHPGTP